MVVCNDQLGLELIGSNWYGIASSIPTRIESGCLTRKVVYQMLDGGTIFYYLADELGISFDTAERTIWFI